jgi:hypothetical protein
MATTELQAALNKGGKGTYQQVKAWLRERSKLHACTSDRIDGDMLITFLNIYPESKMAGYS